MLTGPGIVLAVGAGLIGVVTGCAIGSSGRAGAEARAERLFNALQAARQWLAIAPEHPEYASKCIERAVDEEWRRIA